MMGRVNLPSDYDKDCIKEFVSDTHVRCRLCSEDIHIRYFPYHLKDVHETSVEDYVLLIKGLKQIPKCANENCSNTNHLINFTRGFTKFCCKECSTSSKEFSERMSTRISNLFKEDKNFMEKHSKRSSQTMRDRNKERDKRNNEYGKYVYAVANSSVCKVGICSEFNLARVHNVKRSIPNSEIVFLEFMDIDSAYFIEEFIFEHFNSLLFTYEELDNLEFKIGSGRRELLKFSPLIVEKLNWCIHQLIVEFW